MGYTVERITSKMVKTKFGDKPAYSVMCDGEWFKHGFKKPKFNEGDVVSFEFTEGSYGKEIVIDSVSKEKSSTSATSTASAPKPTVSVPKSGFPIQPNDGQRSIVRQNCVTNARGLFIANMSVDKGLAKLNAEEQAAAIINIARKFEAYACGELDVAIARAMAKAPAEPVKEDNPFEGE